MLLARFSVGFHRVVTTLIVFAGLALSATRKIVEADCGWSSFDWVLHRYANLLRGGAEEFKLDAEFRAWLNAIPTVSSEAKRGNEYWHDLSGSYMPMRPRIWSGGDQSRWCLISEQPKQMSCTLGNNMQML